MQPVVVCLVAYTVGMLIGSYLDSGASPTLLWGTPFLCASLWFLCRARRSAALLFWFLLFLGVGLVRVPLALNAPADTSRLYRYCGPDPVVVEGTVLRVDPPKRVQSICWPIGFRHKASPRRWRAGSGFISTVPGPHCCPATGSVSGAVCGSRGFSEPRGSSICPGIWPMRISA